MRTARDEVTANETLAGALRRALELSDVRYQSGVASFLEVLDAERTQLVAETARRILAMDGRRNYHPRVLRPTMERICSFDIPKTGVPMATGAR